MVPLSWPVSGGGGGTDSLVIYPGKPNKWVKGNTNGLGLRMFQFGEFLFLVWNTSLERSEDGRIWTSIVNPITGVILWMEYAALGGISGTHLLGGYDSGGGPQGHIATSLNGGETWTSRKAALISGGNPNNINSIGVRTGTTLPQRIFLAQDNSQKFSYSDDGGVTWSLSGQIDIVNRTFFTIVNSHANNNIWLAFFSGTCWKSSDNGATWATAALNVGTGTNWDLIHVARLNNGNGRWIVCNTGIDTSDDEGVTFTNRVTGPETFRKIWDSGEHIIAVGTNGSWYSSVDGITWDTNAANKFTSLTIYGIISQHNHWLATDGTYMWSGV